MSSPERSRPTLTESPRRRDPAPRPTLGVHDAVALIVGTVVGAGIFRTPSLVAANAGSESLALLAWVAGGAISLMGALCYAELATTYPNAGGDYHYLWRAFGPRLSFLFGWARISVIQTGSVALLAFACGDYATQIVRLGPYSSAIYAAMVIGLLTAVNMVGVPQGRLAQNVLTTVEVVGLLLIIVAGFFLAAPAAEGAPPPAGGTTPSTLGLVMVFVLLTYGGWNEAAYVSAELREPRRNMVRALVWSLLIVTGLYVLVNAAYIGGLGLSAMAGSQAVAADLMQRAVGERGAQLVSLLIVVSALTSGNATVFTGARSAYAVGRDVHALRFLGRWHQRTETPANALLVQGAAALLLVGLGAATRNGFETMVEFTAPVFWLFFLLAGVSLLILRHSERERTRPFRVPLYPLTPLVFCASSAYLLYASLVHTGVGALVGVAVLSVGGLVALLVRVSATPGQSTTPYLDGGT
jgi:basic amino acid/polyamine antiporter, APA family